MLITLVTHRMKHNFYEKEKNKDGVVAKGLRKYFEFIFIILNNSISTVFLHERKIVVSSPRTAQVLHTHYFLKSHRFQPINLSKKNRVFDSFSGLVRAPLEI